MNDNDNDDFESVRTLLRTFDIDPITRPDVDEAMRRGLRHRRLRLADKGLAVAAVALVVAGGAYFAAASLRFGVSTEPATQATASLAATPFSSPASVRSASTHPSPAPHPASSPPSISSLSTPAASAIPCDAVSTPLAAQQRPHSSAMEAIAAFLGSGKAPAGMAKTGWTSPDGSTYISGKSRIQIVQPTLGSYVVVGAAVC